jgi:hypothetical protein
LPRSRWRVPLCGRNIHESLGAANLLRDRSAHRASRQDSFDKLAILHNGDTID